ncbi:MAG: hypothetical protein QXN57_02275 [Desulfurococcaceae archaeon]
MYELKYMSLAVLAILIFSLAMPISSIVMAEDTVSASEPSINMPVLEFKGGWGKLKVEILLNLTVNSALELAYTVRNITYELFQWEIKYNVTAAKIQLSLGEGFLEKSLNTSKNTPRNAVVYAFVAAIHYSHAPALANPVLGRVIHDNLGENNTITEQTVRAVNSTAYELRDLLVSAINYAKNSGYNTSLPEFLLSKGDERLSEAETYLDQGNVTCAFRVAVSAYRTYVRAYGVLVRSVIVQFLEKQINIQLSTSKLVEVKESQVKNLLNVLPLQIREVIKEKVEKGELKNLSDVVEYVKKESIRVREQLMEREKENLKIAVKNMIGSMKKEFRNITISDEDIEKLIEKYYEQGFRGTDLARKVLTELANMLQEQAREKVMQALTPVSPKPMKK